MYVEVTSIPNILQLNMKVLNSRT